MSIKETNWAALYAPTDGQANVPGFLSHTLPITKLELSISARNLLNMDLLSKSDPQCFVYMRESSAENWREIGRTESVRDNLNPDFVAKILVDYNFEKVQYLKFALYDIDINEHDYLGECCTTLPEIVANKSRQFIKDIRNLNYPKRNCGKLIVVAEELSICKRIAKFKFRLNNVRPGSCFNLIKPSLFLKISRSNEDSTFTVVHETKVKWYTRNPDFDPIEIKVRTLCNSDFDRTIKIEAMNFSATGDHQSIAGMTSSLNQFLDSNGLKKYELKSKSKKVKGELELKDISLSDAYTFFDYLKGGLELNFAVAIDFTQSNGSVDSPQSLHYIDQINGRPNSYEIALKSIGDIIQYYNSTKQYPGFGFGAKVAPHLPVSHRFALNGSMEQPYCDGVESLIHFYKQMIRQVILYGPTNFAPIIEYTADIASKNMHSNNYFILLIITDGVICDLENTKRSIIRASSLPMSIIIVGVGSADFESMNELDSDTGPLEQDGKKAARDIVQFTELRSYLRPDGTITNQGDLARDVLYEVPDQVESYFKLHGLKPGQKRMN